MATIPRIPQAQPSVSYGRLPSVDTSAINRGVATVQESTQQMVRVFDKIQEERDISAAHRSTMAFQDATTDKLAQIKNLRGSDAAGITDDMRKWYNEQSSKFADGLNTRSRTLFKSNIDQQYNSVISSVSNHESAEHQRDRESVWESQNVSDLKFVDQNPEDEDSFTRKLEEQTTWIDFSHPGIDNSELKAQAGSGLVSTRIRALQRTGDIVGAKKVLDQYGHKLIPSVRETLSRNVNIDFNYSDLKTKYPDQFNQQYDLAKQLPLDEDSRRKIMGRIESDQAEYLERERQSDQEHIEAKTNFDLQVTIDFYDGKLSYNRLRELAEKDQITKATFEHLTKELRDPLKSDNPALASDLYDQAARGSVDFEADLKEAFDKGQITGSTYKNLRKTYSDKGVQRVVTRLNDALKPSQLDRWDVDKNVKHANAVGRLHQLLGDGYDPDTAYQMTINEFLDASKRNVQIPEMPYVTGDKDNLDDINTSIQNNKDALTNGQISWEEYRYRSENLYKQKDKIIEKERLQKTIEPIETETKSKGKHRPPPKPKKA